MLIQNDAVARAVHADRIPRDPANPRVELRSHAAPTPVRRTIGRSMVRLGAWLAAEPHLQPTRSR